MIYPSKKDLWLVVLLVVAFLLPFLFALYNLLAANGDRLAGWSMLLITGFIGPIAISLIYTIDYEITLTELKIRYGWLIQQQIALTAIEAVSRTNNPLSAPAPSLDRLRVDYRQGEAMRFALISPADQRSFLREMANRAGLEMQGDRLVRTARGN